MKTRLNSIKKKITDAAVSCGRDPADIRLVAVSKRIPENKIREAIEAGADILGENFIQEAREKTDHLSSCNVSWHFIGHLQSNKSKYAVRMFDFIHTVDSIKLALEINKRAEKINKIQNILIQVNISGELSKSGVEPEKIMDLLKEISRLKNISVKGLMTMPPYFSNPEKARPFFASLRKLREAIKKEDIPGIFMEELSMGMTGDFEAAIEEGATLVRIGTAIFGKRV
ncbi:YggS family pyridoxal phosphate-dependent enzyme [Desulfosarcina sp. BuS5]|uniref:YggS family pyridoxal phosphate-dependent enzyme n=1 Tax=Desulfosarcina sp. BuS5 TaxID=933262 RepID=UPI0005525A19|nr:YggS family pyridoxal phosphate-dependent enzyme [Desulfosarcina sp. BuS5]